MAAILSGVTVLYFAPPRLFIARILLVMTGIVCMVGLSELSKTCFLVGDLNRRGITKGRAGVH